MAFDHLILMHQGRVMYQGAVAAVPEYFKARGHAVPPHYNPADWIMAVAQSVPPAQLDADGFFQPDNRNLGEARQWSWHEDQQKNDSLDEDEDETMEKGEKRQRRLAAEPRPGIPTQIKMLFEREINGLRRNKSALKARFGLTTTLSTLIGCIFFQVGTKGKDDDVTLQSAFGAVIMVLFMSMFGTAMPSLLAFPEERPVFLREYSTNHYAVVSYFVSRLTMEAFITAVQMLVMTNITYWMIGFQMEYRWFYLTPYALAMTSTALAVTMGCSVEETKLATEMLPALFVPQVLLSGFFVAPGLMPSWLKWARYVCPLTYGVRIYLVNEFHNCEPDSPKATENCNRVVDNVEADPDEAWWYWAVLVSMFLFFRILALAILQRKALKYY